MKRAATLVATFAAGIFFVGCAGSPAPTYHFDRYDSASDMFVAMGMRPEHGSTYSFVGGDARSIDTLKQFCEAKGGNFSLYGDLNYHDSGRAIYDGTCKINGEDFFSFYFSGRAYEYRYAIDEIAKKRWHEKVHGERSWERR